MDKLPEGLWPVMLTPFQGNNELDLPGLKRLTEFYMAAGANGLFANCLSSEMFQLTEEERLKITKTVVNTAGGRLPVIATGTFGSNIEISSAFIKRLYDTGVTAVVISTSQLCDAPDSDDKLKNKIEALMSVTESIPLGLYECPVPYKRLISPEVMKWLAQTGRFLYHKDTSCNLDQIRKKIETLAGTPLGLYNANIPTGLDSLLSGASGLSPIAANFYPELFSYLLKQWKDGKKRQNLEKLNAMLSIMEAVIHQNYPYSAKLFLRKRGLKINTNCRVDSSPMEFQDNVKLEAVMTVFGRLTEELNIETVRFKSSTVPN